MQHADRVLDRDLETLTASKTAWARLPVERKILLLRAVQRNTYRCAQHWAERSAQAKGLAPGSPLAGEEWISGPWAVLYALRRYIRSLEDISASGSPRLPRIHAADGRAVMNVFPHDVYDRALLNGIRASVWMQRGVSAEDVRSSAAAFYRQTQPEGRVALILGAGNISSIAPLDVLYKMLAEGAVCILKLNPVNAYLGPVFERVLEPLADSGYVRFAYGGAEAGAYLCAHDAVDEIHVTGSEETHNAIAARTAKRITSELGNVSPTIVIPGIWSRADIAFQAEQIATQKAHNAGFNCIAAQVLVLPREWRHSQALREAIEEIFARMEQRPEYYPGADRRRSAVGAPATPLRSIVRVSASDLTHSAFTSEAFCGVLACVELDGDPESYVRRAVTFANDVLRGTLGANLVAHPATMRTNPALVDGAIEQLRYGCVAVNAWAGVGYLLTELPWGAFPGHTREEPGSGIGVVHNSYFLERTEKSVVRAPFTPFPRSLRTGERTLLPKPPWFVTNCMQAEIGRALCEFEYHRTAANAINVASLALRA
jgi:aldehyde dehydrogenase (NAD(P)+)